MGDCGRPPAEIAALLSVDPPRFSAGERRRRRSAALDLLDAHDLDALVAYGAHRTGSAITWLSGWPTTREAALIMTRDEPDVLFVQFRNHAPQAATLANPGIDVRWGGASTTEAVRGVLRSRGATGRIGVLGPLPHGVASRLGEVATCVPLDDAYTGLRLVKSDEEIAWLRAGAWLSDRGIDALARGLRPGITEHEAVAMAEHAYAALGGTTHICYVASTSMGDPHRCVPGQFPTARRLAAGDVVIVELSAALQGYAGQVLRTFTVDAPPTPRFARLHAVAEAAHEAVLAVVRDGTTPAQLRDATGVIEDAGLTTCDDVVHGFGGGYLPPVIASSSHDRVPLPDVALAAGMTVVVQPTVVTPDGRAGVQTGELVLVTATGHERLHSTPLGTIAAGSTRAVHR
jgi:Xaa-Pro dipeptidase